MFFKPETYSGELKEGMRVKVINEEKEYCRGRIYDIAGDKQSATIKRDDGVHGDGVRIPGYGNGWIIHRRGDGVWHYVGRYFLIPLNTKINWKELVEGENE